MNIPSRHHTWLIVAILVVALSACTSSDQPIASSTTPTQSTPSSTTPTPTTPTQPTSSPTTSNQSTPTQTLATFCSAMLAGNNDLATAQFTPHGLQDFQPPGQTRKAYSSCKFDPISTPTGRTVPGHLVVVTVGNNTTYSIAITLILDGGRWKIDSWVSHKQSANTTVSSTPTPSSAQPAQTLAAFCTAMKAGNNAVANAQFTPQGLLQFQPPGDLPRNRYSSCTYDQVTIHPDRTTQGHLVVVTVGDNETYAITLTLILDGNNWKINSWVSHKQSADAPLQSYLE